MAKKTSAQKGYRKTAKKKPFLTKGELIGAIIILVVFVAVLMCMLNDDFFHVFYNDGTVGPATVSDGDIVAYASPTNHKRYNKIATANEDPAFTREITRYSDNVPYSYKYFPVESDGALEYVQMYGSVGVDPSTTRDYLSNSTPTEIVEIDVNGITAKMFSYCGDYYNEAMPAAEAPVTPEATVETEMSADNVEQVEEVKQPSNYYYQTITAYIPADENQHNLVVRVVRSGSDDSVYLNEEELAPYFLQFSNLYTVNGSDK